MLTAYCKKCKQDVSPGDVCPLCGGKLTKAAQRVHWETRHDPVRDWMCWNAAARIVLPVMALTAVLLLGLEALTGGMAAVTRLMQGGFLPLLGTAAVIFFLVTWLVLLMQGEETLEGTVDSKGAHVITYLEDPTPLQLAARLKPASLAAPGRVEVARREIPWKDIARIQLWEEKLLILFYAPSWWMRLSLPVTAETYPSVILYLHDKLGKKKTVRLPDLIRTPGEDFAALIPAPDAPAAPDPAPVWASHEEPAPESAPPPLESPDAPLPDDQVAGGEQGSMFA